LYRTYNEKELLIVGNLGLKYKKKGVTTMPDKELQVRTLFEKMLKDTEEYTRTYEHYA